MSAPTGTRGRPATLKKADIQLEDGSVLTMRLVGKGDTVQIDLPAQWNLSALSRSITTNGGRTRMSFTAEPPTEA